MATKMGPKVVSAESGSAEFKRACADVLRGFHGEMVKQGGYERVINSLLRKMTTSVDNTEREAPKTAEAEKKFNLFEKLTGHVVKSLAILAGGALAATVALSLPVTAPLMAAATGLTAATMLGASIYLGVMTVGAYAVGSIMGVLEDSLGIWDEPKKNNLLERAARHAKPLIEDLAEAGKKGYGYLKGKWNDWKARPQKEQHSPAYAAAQEAYETTGK